MKTPAAEHYVSFFFPLAGVTLVANTISSMTAEGEVAKFTITPFPHLENVKRFNVLNNSHF